MNWTDWCTDLADIYRVQDVKDGALTRHERVQVSQGIPCRIYQSDNKPINMTQTASNVSQNDHLACDISVDIQAGDELLIHRGGRLGKPGPTIRAFAGDPNLYYEPFGAIIPGLAHQEIRLLQQERVKGGADNGGNAGGASEAAPEGRQAD